MDMINVNVEKRLIGTKGMIRQLKLDGFVPGVLYSDADSISISLKEDEIRSFLQHNGEGKVLNISFDGKVIPTIIKEIQRAPVTLDIQHVDLMPATPGVLH